jgi:AcrR family transcriptional regulator
MNAGIRAQATATRRRAILDAALGLFVESGVSATNLDQILERSGASVGSFYHHFDDKVDVAATLYFELLDEYFNEFLAAVRRHRSAEAGIKAGVRYHLKWVERETKGAIYIAHRAGNEAQRESVGRIVDPLKRFFGELEAWLNAHAEKHAVRRLPFDVTWALWLGPAEVFTRWWVLSAREVPAMRRAERVLPASAWETLRYRRRT